MLVRVTCLQSHDHLMMYALVSDMSHKCFAILFVACKVLNPNVSVHVKVFFSSPMRSFLMSWLRWYSVSDYLYCKICFWKLLCRSSSPCHQQNAQILMSPYSCRGLWESVHFANQDQLEVCLKLLGLSIWLQHLYPFCNEMLRIF